MNLDRTKLVLCNQNHLVCCGCNRKIEPGEWKYTYTYKKRKLSERNFHWCGKCNNKRSTLIKPVVEKYAKGE